MKKQSVNFAQRRNNTFALHRRNKCVENGGKLARTCFSTVIKKSFFSYLSHDISNNIYQSEVLVKYNCVILKLLSFSVK